VDYLELNPVRVVEEGRVIALDVMKELLRRALDLQTLGENPPPAPINSGAE
jgi:hypothetical protein